MRLATLSAAFLAGIVAFSARAETKGRPTPADEREARQYEQAVYRGLEPTFEKVASFYPPIKYPNAIIGVDGYPGEAYVAWNGDVVFPVDAHYPGKVGEGIYLQFAFDCATWASLSETRAARRDGLPRFVGEREAITRSLRRGYLPVVTTQWERDKLAFASRVFASRLRDDVMVVFVRISLTNRGPGPQAVRFWTRVGRVTPTDSPEAATVKSLPYACPLTLKANGVLREKRDAKERVVCAFAPVGQWLSAHGTTPASGASLGETPPRGPVSPRPESSLGETRPRDAMEYRWEIPAGATREIAIRVPFYPMPVQYEPSLLAMNEESCLARCESDWERFLAEEAQFRVPEPIIADAMKTHLVNNQIMTDEFDGKRLPTYGAYTYDGIMYDFEGEEFLEALDLYGRHAEARRCLEELLDRGEKRAIKPAGTFAEHEGWLDFGDANLYAFGSAGSRAICEHFRMTGDVAWLKKMAPRLRRAAAWIRKARATTRQLDAQGQKSSHYGLIPKGSWCDIQDWEYWFFTSALYYRSLSDMADVLRRVDASEAERLAAEAREFREDILRAVDRSTDRRSDPPFIPLAPYVSEPRADQPDLQTNRNGMYWSIVGPNILMHCGVVEPGDERSTWILRFLEERNGFLLGNARFSGGIDTKYTYPSAMVYLRRGETSKVLLSLYGIRAYGMSRDTSSTPEVYEEIKTGGTSPRWWIPCLPDRFCNVRFLSLVRNLLVREESGGLYLLDGIPRTWLADGKRIEIAAAPTHFGSMSLQTSSRAGQGEIRCDISLPTRTPPASSVLRLRHPDSTPLKRVTINGQPWSDFDAKRETIRLPAGQTKLVIVAGYR